MSDVTYVLDRCLSFQDEHEWFDFKDSWYDKDGIGQYISALSNAAAMEGEPFGYLIWGIDNKSHNLTNTKIRYQREVNNEPFQHYLARNINPALYFHFDEDIIDGNRVVIMTVPAARTVPTEFKGIRYIRIGSSKENIKKHPEREAALFRILNYEPPTLLNVPSRFKDMSFDQLFVYYESRGIKLKKETFIENLELLTPDGRYNMLAQLLSDNPHVDIMFSLFTGVTKTSTMYADRNFGNMCLLLALDKVLDYGDTLNVPQADERNRKVERKEVMLFDKNAFSEAVINAFAHNMWVDEVAPMFTAYQDRIEITSIGSIPHQQTREGFYRGVSIPVNKKLSEIFLQLHISERSGRGVPRIVKQYGKGAFEFTDNAIIVTIPFNRINLEDGTPQVTPHDNPHDTPHDTPHDDNPPNDLYGMFFELTELDKRIIESCKEPRNRNELLKMLGLNDRKHLLKHINMLIEAGMIIRTIPDKPKSKNQKYVSIK